jgi:hypothetical protein
MDNKERLAWLAGFASECERKARSTLCDHRGRALIAKRNALRECASIIERLAHENATLRAAVRAARKREGA